MEVRLDLVQTLAVAAVAPWVGGIVRRRVPVLDRFNVPDPVAGGLLFAGAVAALRAAGLAVVFDGALQPPLLALFFATVGLGARFSRIRTGGTLLVAVWALASLLALLQNVLGVGVAWALGADPRLGLVAGSMTLTGGYGAGGAFGQILQERGLQGAVPLAIACATFGMVAGGLLGAPLATVWIRRHALTGGGDPALPAPGARSGDPGQPSTPLGTVVLALGVAAAGSAVSAALSPWAPVPAFFGALLIGIAVRNAWEAAAPFPFPPGPLDRLGEIALALFLGLALMGLHLQDLAALALPALAILAAQVVLVAAFAWATWRLLGGRYESAVIAAGLTGFGLGAMPNAMANMEALALRYGPAPRAFLVVPVVGAFLVDATNLGILAGFTWLLH